MKHRLPFSIPALILMTLAFSPCLTGAASEYRAAAAPPLGQESDGVFVVRVYYDSIEDINLLTGFDLFEFNNLEEKYVLVAVDRAGLHSLEALGFRTVVDEQQTANFARPDAQSAERIDPMGVESIPGYACYRTVEETYATAQAIAAAHPELATWIDAGDSWEKATVTSPDLAGYDLMVLKLTNSAISGDKPNLFVTAAIHAREYATAELATRLAEYLVDNYGVDADATWLLDHHEIHVMFLANPDGRKKAEAGASWRKNTDNDDGCTSSGSWGVDLNRNFTYQWGGVEASSSPCNETYRGPSAGSEPEIQAIQSYMEAIFPDQRGPDPGDLAPVDATGLYIDLHSYSELVLWPWGYTSGATPNGSALQTLGRKVAYFNGYMPDQWYSGLYPSSGIEIDYAYGALGVAALEFEVGTSFFQSCSYFESTLLPENLPALVYAAKVARSPYVTPAGPDAVSPALSATGVEPGTPVTLSATINDTRYNTSNGAESTQNIAAAEYYVDAPPWNSGTAHAMAASDGSFSSSVEGVTASIDTAGWTAGRHIVFVRGKDAGNSWGAFSALFLTVTDGANRAPTANPQSVSTPEDRALGITLSGSDPDGDPLAFTVTAGPAHGALSGSGANRTYTPAANTNGPDSFTFVVNDGQINSAPATVSISVTPVNDAPSANSSSVTTAEDMPLSITLSGSDVDGDPLTFTVTGGPAHGALSGSGANRTYTPAANTNGPDSLTFVANDGQVNSAPATVSISVTPVNDAPSANSSSVTTAEDMPLSITLSGSDVDGDPLTFTVTGGPAHGALSGSGVNRTYTPAANTNGPDSFTFVVNDGQINSAPATVSISVTPVNDAPSADDASVETIENAPVAIALAGSDPDGDPLTFIITGGPDHGTLTGSAPDLIYAPQAGYAGADRFTFKVNDGQVDSVPATVNITVAPDGLLRVFIPLVPGG